MLFYILIFVIAFLHFSHANLESSGISSIYISLSLFLSLSLSLSLVYDLYLYNSSTGDHDSSSSMGMSSPIVLPLSTKQYNSNGPGPGLFPLYFTKLWQYQHPLHEPELCDHLNGLRDLVYRLEETEDSVYKSNKGTSYIHIRNPKPYIYTSVNYYYKYKPLLLQTLWVIFSYLSYALSFTVFYLIITDTGGWQYPKDFALLASSEPEVAKMMELMSFQVPK